MSRMLLGLFLATHLACTTTNTKEIKKQDDYTIEQVWHKGTMESALMQSKKENKPLFVYWGAVWCPPCNEIKDQVFSKPRFGELMNQFIPVYLDGDSEEAQTWGDKLKAYGYPTILVLSPNGEELLRINGGVNLQEFELALSGAQSRSLDQLIKKAQNGTLDNSGWQAFSFISWEQLPKEKYQTQRIWKIQKELIEKAPQDLAKVRAILTASFLKLSVKLNKKDNLNSNINPVKEKAEDYLNHIFKNNETVLAVRGFINYSGVNVLLFAFNNPNNPSYKKWEKRWLEASLAISESNKLSVDSKLWAIYPQIQFFKAKNKGAEIPKPLQEKIIKASLKADKEAKSKYERHSVISGAAYLLRVVKAYNEAESMLKKELKQTDTPWYYQSSLSYLAEAQGKPKEALYWSSLARKSAKGRASRLQWITSDLVLTAKVESKDKKRRLLSLAKEYYELATELRDGFSGRNRFRAARVSKSLQAWKKDREFMILFKNYQPKCAKLESTSKNHCSKHFNKLTNI